MPILSTKLYKRTEESPPIGMGVVHVHHLPGKAKAVKPKLVADLGKKGSGIAPGGSDMIFHGPGDAGSSTTITNQGGAIIGNVPVELIFWGNVWTQAANTPSAGSVVNAVDSILSGPYMTALSQYGVGRGLLRGAIIVLDDPPSPTFQEDNVHSLISDLIDQGTFPEPDDNDGRNLYLVIMPPGTNYNNVNLIGNHTYDTDYDFPFDWDKAWYAWVMNDGTLATITSVLSHELVEAVTDPEGDGWQINPTNSSNWNEIGDACSSTGVLNGVTVQSYWSQRDLACIIPTGLLTGKVTGIPSLVQSRFGSQGNFEMVTPLADGGLAHYWRDNDNSFLPWNGPNVFARDLGVFSSASLIQSNYGDPGNLEVVGLTNNMLAHFWRDSGPAFNWSGAYYIGSLVAWNAALIQSRFGNQGNFELISPEAAFTPDGGINHYWRDNDDPNLPWYFGATFGRGDRRQTIEAVTLIQSNFGNPGNLEVVARSGDRLFFFWRDSGPAFNWSGAYPLIADGNLVTGVSGNPALIQSRFGNQGNFELVVPLERGGLAHFWRDNDDPDLPWHGPYAFATEAGRVDAVSLIESNFGSPGNLEVVGRMGTQLVFFWRDSGPAFNWNGPYFLTDGL